MDYVSKNIPSYTLSSVLLARLSEAPQDRPKAVVPFSALNWPVVFHGGSIVPDSEQDFTVLFGKTICRRGTFSALNFLVAGREWRRTPILAALAAM